MTINAIDLHIGQKLREIRIAAKMSQEQVGELIGVSLQQVQKYEICINRISAGKLYEFARIFDQPIAAFFEGCVADRDFDDTSQTNQNKALIAAFGKIKSTETKNHIINLIQSIAEK